MLQINYTDTWYKCTEDQLNKKNINIHFRYWCTIFKQIWYCHPE